MNIIWAGMILIGITYGTVTGHTAQVSETVLTSAKEAVTLGIAMLGVTAVWSGLMEMAKDSGLIEAVSGKLRPLIRFLFPGIPEEHPAASYITMNCVANLLGLGWAATPAGLKAMEELEHLEETRRNTGVPAVPRGVASDEMCTFLILNISSLQLIPVNIIAYRAQYGSVDPTAIIIPGILATSVSTAAAVIFCKVTKSEKFSKKFSKHETL